MTDDGARLFIALELPAAVRKALVSWGADRLSSTPGVRTVEADALHVTLCFLGSHPVGEIEPIAAACQMLTRWPRVVLTLGRALWLPARRPRVLAVALTDRDGRLADMQAGLGDRLAQGGWYKRERRHYLANVTVARAGRGASPKLEPPVPPAPISFPGTMAVLLRSHTDGRRPRYEPLAEFWLARGLS